MTTVKRHIPELRRLMVKIKGQITNLVGDSEPCLARGLAREGNGTFVCLGSEHNCFHVLAAKASKHFQFGGNIGRLSKE